MCKSCRLCFCILRREDEAERKLINNTLINALETLKEKQKKRIVEYFFYDKTQQEIADKEGVNRFAIEKSISLGLEKIKKYFEKRVSKQYPLWP